MRSAACDPRMAGLLGRMAEMDVGRVRLMEVCGTHTMAIAKSGIRQMLPENVELISGPGCPVCVTPAGAMDVVLRLSEDENVILVSYGDMIRVPGSRPGDNLLRRRARGARVEMVYSPLDALEIARENPGRQVVFLGVGFETTAPGTAATILQAKADGIGNFSVLSLLKRVEPALRALMAQEGFDVQGFLCPGHVAAIIGEAGFEFLPGECRMPSVISGFEPEDILLSVYDLLKQIAEGRPRLGNTYRRAVRPGGNPAAMEMMNRCLEPREDSWRGLGVIPMSGMGIRSAYADFDAQKRFGLELVGGGENTACRCGDVICGRLRPWECPLFGKRCLPEDPVGPCMVSGEGACAAAYKYGEANAWRG